MGFIACTDDNQSTNSQGVKLNFNAPGIVARTSASTRATLSTGTTVRVLAYQRVGASSDLSADIYMGENTYVTASDGSLSACVTDDEGKVTSDTGTDMTLRSGTYDFYAVTPALAVTRNSGATVSVDHGKDYATSLTENVSIGTSSTNQSVTLTTLDRKCAQLIFNIDRGAESVTSVIVDELTLSEIATAPLTGSLAADLPAAATNSGTVSLASSAFTADATNAWKASGSVAILPKSSATYELTLTARFNGSSTARTMSTTVPAIAFEKGMQYTYTLQLYGDKIVLKLSSTSSWETTSWSADAVGDGTLKNLSVNTSGTVATANCYIVNTANQDYKFKATVMGNGATTPAATSGDQTAPAIVPTALSPVTALVIWETGSKGDVIQDGSVKLIGNGYVTFKTANNSTNGNALIGVADSDGTLLWSWHIWKTTYTPDTDYDTYAKYSTGTTFKMMKYNLGATSISTWSASAINAGDLGLFYEWGRKDPFVGAKLWTNVTSGTGAERITTTNTAGYEWKDGSSSAKAAIAASSATVSGFTDLVAASIEYARRNPTHYIYYSSETTYDWLNASTYATQRDNLWGNPNTSSTVPNAVAGSKSIYDPCPPGWRVPTQDSFQIFTQDGGNVETQNASDSFSNGWIFYISAYLSGSTSFWPASGHCDSASGGLILVSDYGSSWSSSSRVSGEFQGGDFDFHSGVLYPLGYNPRTFGLSVRCTQE